ncbi:MULTISPECIES: peptidoglycan editing factor PgeF [Nitrincola]|uniref:Purine nucleoside phosphorylase n=1 Tax=Nitrincola nitratireducens TaxID=1229521 RepID=W9UTL1_9GAMM|nr:MULTISPECIES: peptidoglycan editing factor PgeF [Nitrincola]EXJ10414.1 Laccase domain protein yfiH [Nitrincola nitratireducens]
MKLIRADWDVSPRIHAFTTTRYDGVSEGVYAGFNLGLHVGDDPAAVLENRKILQQVTGLTQPIRWLEQVHGINLVKASGPECQADAVWSNQPGEACAIMTADCLPVLFCDRAATRVAAAHAGWRGLAAGVLENTLSIFDDPKQVVAWLGPAIGPMAFEVGDEVYQCFCEQHPQAKRAFAISPTDHQKWLADIYELARIRLHAAGVKYVYGGHFCTFTDHENFYSYRRDGETGRMASLIWIEG